MNPGAGSAKPLEEDGLVLGVRPGATTIERTTVPIPGASMEACVIVLRRA
jgi:hypothetical protein